MLTAAALTFMGHDDLAAEHFGDQVTQWARDLRLHTLLDIAAHCVRLSGQPVPKGTDPLLYLERKAYIHALRETIRGLESARMALAGAVQRLEP